MRLLVSFSIPETTGNILLLVGRDNSFPLLLDSGIASFAELHRKDSDCPIPQDIRPTHYADSITLIGPGEHRVCFGLHIG